MGMAHLSQDQVDNYLKSLGNWRVERTQIVGGRLGVYELALALRETHAKNIDGGAVWDADKNRWVFAPLDSGIFQISREHNSDALRTMVPCVKSGTWSPYINDHTPAEAGYCPRFEEALQFTTRNMNDAIAMAVDYDLPSDGTRTRFGVAAHNAGRGGALKGWRESKDVDKYTTYGDYSAWVFHTAAQVRKFFVTYPHWEVS